MAFVLPHVDSIRPWWLVRAGLYLYDALAWGTQLPHSRGLRQSDVAYRTPLRGLGKGFVYSDAFVRSEEHTSELQSLMRISYAVFCLKKKTTTIQIKNKK